MLLHFEQLMGFKIQEVLNQSLEKKAKVTLEYLRQNYIQKKKIKQILWQIEAVMSSKNDQRPVAIGVFFLLLAYFEEDQELMLVSRGVANVLCLGGSKLQFCRQSGRGIGVGGAWS